MRGNYIVVVAFFRFTGRVNMSEEKRNYLKEVCEETVKLSQFQPGAYGKGKTHCNNGSHRIASIVGAKTNVFFNTSLTVMPANKICVYAEKLAQENIISELSIHFAQERAWQGEVVLICARNRNPGKSGHVSIMYPSEPPDNEGLRAPVMIANAGGINAVSYTHLTLPTILLV